MPGPGPCAEWDARNFRKHHSSPGGVSSQGGEKSITPALLTCGLAGRVWCGVRVRDVQSLPEQRGLETTQTSVVRTWRERRASQAAVSRQGTNTSQARGQPLASRFSPTLSTTKIQPGFSRPRLKKCVTPLGQNRCPLPTHSRHPVIISITAVTTINDCVSFLRSGTRLHPRVNPQRQDSAWHIVGT